MKPKRGIEYLRQNGFVSDEPSAMAEFFKRTDIGLDKTSVGDFLGENKPFNEAVLASFTDSFEFVGLEIDFALRSYLEVFRLPGEAQKISRMMEKFAERFFQDNPDKFANADTAFVLAFSVIMLQTDLHNPQVKNKMTKAQFLRNNSGIDDGKDLQKEYLENLYDSVQAHPMSLKEDDELREKLESKAVQSAGQRFELFTRETQNIMAKSQEVLEQRALKQKSSTHIVARSAEHVRPFFEVACWPVLATLAVLLEMPDEQVSVDLCMEGFTHCIRLAARFGMDTERDAIVSSLAKFTYLTTIKEMKQKNIECIKVLLTIGLSEGNSLGASWQYVLFCISHLERLQLIKIRARDDSHFFTGGEESPGSRGSAAAPTATPGEQVAKRRSYGAGVSAMVPVSAGDRQVELVNSESVMSQIDAAQIDLLFNRSVTLESGPIVHFVSQLARVSQEELESVDQPRIFAMQKLVEVADYNMGREPLVWSRIWHVLSQHFVQVARHSSTRVCMYAVDSMRQLAEKFLDQERRESSSYQSEALGPFEAMMTGSPSVSREVKELIISSVSHMLQSQSRTRNIKGGWRAVFRILHAAAQDQDSEAMSDVAFAAMECLVEQRYHLSAENFDDGVRTMLAFAQCRASLKVSLQAIAHLQQGAEYLARDGEGPAVVAEGAAEPEGAAADTAAEASRRMARWFLILGGRSPRRGPCCGADLRLPLLAGPWGRSLR